MRRSIRIPRPKLPRGKLTPQKIIIFLLLLLGSWIVSEYESKPAFQQNSDSTQVTVTRVVDGDTIRTSNNETIRLIGIDAPEIAKLRAGQVIEPAGYYADDSKKLLESLALDKEIYLYPEEPIYDNYRRRLAELVSSDGQSINEQMVASGAAVVYQFSNLSSEQKERLIRAQQKAMRDQRGFWGRILNLKDTSKPVIGNKSSKRFFPRNCQAAEKVAEHNKTLFSSAIEAFEEGYSPARECDFWPTE